MVKIRLKRGGSKKRPYYHIVVIPSYKKRDGSAIDTIGFYNPIDEANLYHIEEEKAIYWFKNGAQPTDKVMNLLKKSGILEKIKGEKTPSAE